ncbi:AAA family ATPase [Micromonospora echinofusca]|uniref:AAA family ATPase n=1 Tax=Micromonospora echinofusca TaxID=47858 RepID=A0ABS3VZ09_MICEH|nr:AAA family ATPase [Micromonospora echinofusca]
MRTLDVALGQPPAVILLEGEAGIGKTRLLREFLTAPAGRRHRSLVGACPPLREPYTLGAVVDAVREGVGNVSGLRLSGLAGALRPLFPEWAADLPPSPEPLEDPTAARHRLFRAFVELLGRLDVSVLALEDVHWADDATLEFLLFLAARRPQPVSVVVTYRPEELSPDSLLRRLSSRLPADAHLVRLALRPLKVDETAAFVSSMLAAEHVSAEFATFLHLRTDGVPLALEESVRLMHDRADLVRRDGGWARRRLDRIEVPPTIRDAVLERVGRLRPDTRTVLHAAAVLAAPADYPVLLAVTELPADRVGPALAEAVACGLLREDGRGHLSYRHALACHAVYEAVPVPERRHLHLRAGRAVEASALPSAAQLAHHFRQAGETGAWCRYAEQAADLSTQSGDVATAALLLHNLVSTAALPADALVRLVAKIHFQSLPDADPYWAAVDALRSALRSATLTPHQEAVARFQLGRVLMVAGAMEEGRREIERAMTALAPDSVEAARARTLLALPLGAARPAAAHLRWLREAPPLAPSIASYERLRLRQERTFALLMLGEESAWAEARRLPDDSDDPPRAGLIAISHTNFTEAALRWGRYEEARSWLAKARKVADSHQFQGLLGAIASSQARLDWCTGAWDGLTERVDALVEIDGGVWRKDQCEAALFAGLLQAAAGDREQAVQRLLLAGRDDQQRIEAAAALATLYLHDGLIDDALKITADPVEVTVRHGIWTRGIQVVPVRVDALVAAGRLDEAADLVAAFHRALPGTAAPAPQAALELCRAMLAEAHGPTEQAAALFARAAAAWQALPCPYEALLARERQARCLAAAGQHGTALPLLADVARQFTLLGARNDADRVTRTLHEHGWQTTTTRGRGRPGYGDQLSPREREVARLLIGGRTNRQIADTLTVSVQTVASQVRSAMRKLRVDSRTALAIRVVELGLTGDEGRPPARDR